MLHIINYKGKTRLVLLLGQTDSHFYCLASEKIPESIAKSLYEDLKKYPTFEEKVAFLKFRYPQAYKASLRSLMISETAILRKFE